MINCFIKIVDGQPFEHPIMEDNFRLAYPEIDPDNLPENFARFTRLPYPAFSPRDFKRASLTSTYIPCEGGWMDDWGVEDLTEEEKAAVITEWTNIVNEAKANARSFAVAELATSTDAVAIRVLTDFIAAIDSHTFTDPFVGLDTIPRWPAKNEDKSYVDTSA